MTRFGGIPASYVEADRESDVRTSLDFRELSFIYCLTCRDAKQVLSLYLRYYANDP